MAARRLRRYAGWTLVVLAVLALVAINFARSTRALEWAAAQLSASLARTGASLEFEQLSGSLFTTIGAGRITYLQGDTRAQLTEVELDVSLWALWDRQLRLDRIAIVRIELDTVSSGEPMRVPESLALPLEVRVDEATVGALVWRSGETAVELADLALRYRGGPQRHEVESLSVRLAQVPGLAPGTALQLSLSGDIDAQAPFALSARLRAHSDALGTADIVLGGRLAELAVQASVAGSGAYAAVKAALDATVAPFDPAWLPRAELRTGGLDLAALVQGAPRTALDLRIEAAAGSDRPVTGRLFASNRLAGELGSKRIPVTGLQASFTIDPAARRVQLSPLRIELSGKGRLSGRGTIAAPASGELTTDWQLQVADLDLKALDARLVETALSGRATLALTPQRQRFDVALDQRDMRLEAIGQRNGPEIVLDRVLARTGTVTGAGEVSGQARIRIDGERAFAADLQFRAFDPSRFLSQALPDPAAAPVAPGPLAPAEKALATATATAKAAAKAAAKATAKETGKEKTRLNATVTPESTASSAGSSPPSAAGGSVPLAPLPLLLPAASLNARIKVQGRLDPSWQVQVDADIAPSRIALGVPTAGEPARRMLPLQGRVRGLFSPDRVEQADVQLAVGRNRLRATGSVGVAASVLDYRFEGAELAQLLPGLDGRLDVSGQIAGRPSAPTGSVDLKAARLSWAGSTAGALSARGDFDFASRPARIEAVLDAKTLKLAGVAIAQVGGRFSGSPEQHKLSLTVRATDIDAHVLLDGGLAAVAASASDGVWRERLRWSGRLVEAENEGRYRARLVKPATLELSPTRVELGPAQVSGIDGRFQVDELRWEPGRLSTRGSLSAFPVGGLVEVLIAPEAVEGIAPSAPGKPKAAPAYESTLRIGGQWSLTSSPRLNGSITLRRESGDVSLRASPPFLLGLSRVDLDARFSDDRVQTQARIEGSALGQISAALALDPTASGLSLDSPMTLRADLEMHTLRPFARYVGTAIDLDGALSASIEGGGTPRKPQLSGVLRGERLRVDAPQLGIAFRDGRLDARLADGVLQVVALEARGGDGRFTASGNIPLRAGAVAAPLNWKAERLSLLSRPDRRVVIDGNGRLAAEQGQLVLSGRVSVREGYLEFGQATRTQLGNDVVILGDTTIRPVNEGAARSPLVLRLDIDFGKAFRVFGSGLDTLLTGQLALTTAPNGTLTAKGTVRTSRGTFSAFGQRLVIERGELVFNGPLDNPGLDVLALRRFPQVEVGVQISGTVRALRVNITSNPPMPQGEQLSWLVLGRGLDSASQGDAALIASIGASMLGGDGGVPVTRRIADAFGVDDVGVRGSSVLEGQVFTVGKRLSDRIYIAYEQALNAATNLLRIEFVLHRFVSLRAEAGAVSGFGIFYTRSLP